MKKDGRAPCFDSQVAHGFAKPKLRPTNYSHTAAVHPFKSSALTRQLALSSLNGILTAFHAFRSLTGLKEAESLVGDPVSALRPAYHASWARIS